MTHILVDSVSRVFETAPPFGKRVALTLGIAGERPRVRALQAVSLDIARGEVLGLVGESGSGKSTLARIIDGILSPSSGGVLLDGARVRSEGRKARKTTTRVQMVFQDPYASLDPRMRIGDIVAEGPLAHRLVGRSRARAYVEGWLARVGMPADAATRYPHQFSGGQRQRIAIARALAMRPAALVCDEPVASLDVSIQAQVLNLLLGLRRELSLTMVFISHHLGVVRHVADRVAVMYLGRIVEIGPTEAVYADPRHPYTKALLASMPHLTFEGEAVAPRPIRGELPSPLSPPPGCAFHQRCPFAEAVCKREMPVLASVGPLRQAACHVATPSARGRVAAQPPFGWRAR
jgi:peptide/nickel transport system ATP-binding protein